MSVATFATKADKLSLVQSDDCVNGWSHYISSPTSMKHVKETFGLLLKDQRVGCSDEKR